MASARDYHAPITKPERGKRNPKGPMAVPSLSACTRPDAANHQSARGEEMRKAISRIRAYLERRFLWLSKDWLAE